MNERDVKRWRKQRVISAFVGAVALATSARALAAAPIPESLHIVLDGTPAKLRELDTDEMWPKACKALGSALEPGTGPWGLGVFTTHSCQVGAADMSKAPKGAWVLQVFVGKDRTQLAIYQKAASLKQGSVDEKNVMAMTSFRGTFPLDFLAAKGFAPILAADLLAQLPFMARLDAPKSPLLDAETLTVKGAKTAGTKRVVLPAPPKTLAVYTLDYGSDGIWHPHAIGLAKLTKGDGGTPVWQLPKSKIDAKTVPLYAAAFEPRATQRKYYAKRLSNAEGDLEKRIGKAKSELSFANAKDLFRRGASSGFIGVRYGHSVFQGPVIEDMSFIGLLIEMRGSPLDGLRFYYDKWPEVKATEVLTGAESFSGQRMVLGWSFGMDPGFLIDRVDLVPKIGQWSTHAGFLLLSADGVTTQQVDFDVKNALSLGLEGGIEKNVGDFLLGRVWAARDFSFSAFNSKDKTSVTNTRAGVDAVIEGPMFGMMSLSFLAFFLYENVSLAKESGEAKEADQVTIDRIEYDVGYAGGGIALSW